MWNSQDQVGYTLCYPSNWSPSGNAYGNAFEIRNYPSTVPQKSPDQNTASLIVIDTVYESPEAVSRYLDQLAAGDNLLPANQREVTTVDGSRAVRVYRRQPSQVVVSQRPSMTPTASRPDLRLFELDVGAQRHLFSLTGSAFETADQSVVNEILAVEGSFRILTSPP